MSSSDKALMLRVTRVLLASKKYCSNHFPERLHQDLVNGTQPVHACYPFGPVGLPSACLKAFCLPLPLPLEERLGICQPSIKSLCWGSLAWIRLRSA